MWHFLYVCSPVVGVSGRYIHVYLCSVSRHPFQGHRCNTAPTGSFGETLQMQTATYQERQDQEDPPCCKDWVAEKCWSGDGGRRSKREEQ